jgi:hypothetical protein
MKSAADHANHALSAGRAPLVILLCLAALLALMRLHYFDWPPNRDVTTYAVMGHELLSERDLYSEVWDHKPPAIYATYAVTEAVFGYGPLALYVLSLGFALFILFGVYAAGVASGFGPLAGLCAAAFWTALSGDTRFQIQDPHTEGFMNACLIWAFVLFVPPWTEANRFRHLAAAGALFALATLCKPVVITVPLVLGVVHVALAPDGRYRRALTDVAILAGIGVIAWSGLIAYMVATARWEIFYDSMVGFNVSYSGDPLANFVQSFSPNGLARTVHKFPITIPLFVLAGAGMLTGLIWGRRRNWILLLAYAVAAHIAVALPGKFHTHYFQLLLPPLIVACGWATHSLGREMKKPVTWILPAAAAAALLFVIVKQAPLYRWPAEKQLAGTHRELYLVTQELGRELGALLEPDETLFQFGEATGLYFYSQRRPPSKIMCSPLMEGPLAEHFTAQAMADLESRPPDLVVVANRFVRWKPDHPLLQGLEARYRRLDWPSERVAEYFFLMVKSGSAVEARLIRSFASSAEQSAHNTAMTPLTR